jgi:hypothetical protein
MPPAAATKFAISARIAGLLPAMPRHGRCVKYNMVNRFFAPMVPARLS